MRIGDLTTLEHTQRLADTSTAVGIHDGHTRASKRYMGLRDAKRWEEFLGSTAAFFISFTICFVASGFWAYICAQWLGPS